MCKMNLKALRCTVLGKEGPQKCTGVIGKKKRQIQVQIPQILGMGAGLRAICVIHTLYITLCLHVQLTRAHSRAVRLRP